MKHRAEHKKIIYKGEEIADLVTVTNNDERGKSTMFSLAGDKTHVNSIIGTDGTISTHSTTRIKGQEKPEQINLFPSTEAKNAVEIMAKDAESKIMAEEYLGNDLLYFDHELLLKLCSELTKLTPVDEKVQTMDIEKNLENIKNIIEANQDKLLTPISREDLSKYEGKVLINPEKKMLLVYKGKVYDQTNFQKQFYQGISGNFFGYPAFNLDQIKNKIDVKVEKE